MDQTLYMVVKINRVAPGMPYKVESVKYEVGYWRKAYLINHFLLRNCGEEFSYGFNVPLSVLTKLLSVCELILSGNNAALCELVTEDGMQYASLNDMDEQEKKSIQQTVDILKPLFTTFSDIQNAEFEYTATP